MADHAAVLIARLGRPSWHAPHDEVSILFAGC
jgi:hypothetical protein